jgi:cytochrome c-type biogenesis protein CcmH
VNRYLRATLSLCALLIIICKPVAFAGVEVREFDSDKNRQRYHHMIDELRCLVCQNQNLADSNAQLAVELRTIIYDMIKDGKSDKEIVDYMVARYGEFVLYNPPLDRTTFMLWFGPILLLVFVIVLLVRFILKRQQAAPLSLTKEQRARSRKLLEADKETKS